MSVKSKLKSTTGLLGIAGISMAALVAACDGPNTASALVEKTDDGACVITRVAENIAENIDAKANPCAAAKDCNPCAASSGCNPCAAANPCAASGGCNPSAAANPCAASGGCNPCAAANPCNPCAAANPCNPCAAASPCNPCAAANPCNPCAGANPCNPCAAANPCNPCAGANPCNPCAAGAGPVEVSGDEIAAAYDCMKGGMEASYRTSGENGASDYQTWVKYNTRPYVSATHGGRYVNNYANATGAAYGKFEDAGVMPVGAILAKDSLTIDGGGQAAAGPLFLMEKMSAGFDSDNGDWKYTMIMPDGTTWGVTNGKNSAGMQFCSACHVAVAEYDYLFFLPDEFRKE